MDIRLSQQDDFSIDINVASGELVADDGLETSVLISLFTEGLARIDDELPGDEGEVISRRGWWGTDLLELATGTLGSLLWLSRRDKIELSSIERLRERAAASLAWLTAEGIAKSVDVVAERQPDTDTESIALDIKITRPDGTDVNFRFANIWEGTFN